MTFASGRLGAIKPSAATPTAAYTAPVLTSAAFSVAVCNQSATPDTIDIALSASGAGSPASTDYVLKTQPLAGRGTTQISGLVVASGQIVYCLSTNGTASFVVTGYEDAA